MVRALSACWGCESERLHILDQASSKTKANASVPNGHTTITTPRPPSLGPPLLSRKPRLPLAIPPLVLPLSLAARPAMGKRLNTGPRNRASRTTSRCTPLGAWKARSPISGCPNVPSIFARSALPPPPLSPTHLHQDQTVLSHTLPITQQPKLPIHGAVSAPRHTNPRRSSFPPAASQPPCQELLRTKSKTPERRSAGSVFPFFDFCFFEQKLLIAFPFFFVIC